MIEQKNSSINSREASDGLSGSKIRHTIEAVDRHFGIITVIPALLCILLIFGYPIVSNIILSFTNRSMIRKGTDFIAFRNYIRILEDPETWNALKNGVIYAFFTVAVQVLLGFICALLIFKIQKDKPKAVFRNLLLIPWATPFISSVFIWRWIYSDLTGLLNQLLMTAGVIESSIPWLGKPGLAMFAVILRTVWFGIPLLMISILAGMQSIPQGQLDSAYIEGAGVFQTVRFVIFPNVRGIIGVMAVLRTIWTFNNFGNIYAMTGGGPGNSTETLPLLAYETAWGQYLLGKAGALSVLMTIFLAVLLFVYFRVLKIRESVNI
ncbi:MAG: carbohydrate ABC transporter permease [Spirochaetia bacterium]